MCELSIRTKNCACYNHKSAVILLPLRPVSLTNKYPQKRKINHGMCPVGRRDQLIDLNICVFVEISHSCNFCGSYYGIFFQPLLCFKIEGLYFNFSIL